MFLSVHAVLLALCTFACVNAYYIPGTFPREFTATEDIAGVRRACLVVLGGNVQRSALKAFSKVPGGGQNPGIWCTNAAAHDTVSNDCLAFCRICVSPTAPARLALNSQYRPAARSCITCDFHSAPTLLMNVTKAVANVFVSFSLWAASWITVGNPPNMCIQLARQTGFHCQHTCAIVSMLLINCSGSQLVGVL
jgi:hypothetical protein